MSKSAEIQRLKQEAELLRAITAEKGIVGHRLEEAAWSIISRVMSLPDTTCRRVYPFRYDEGLSMLTLRQVAVEDRKISFARDGGDAECPILVGGGGGG